MVFFLVVKCGKMDIWTSVHALNRAEGVDQPVHYPGIFARRQRPTAGRHQPPRPRLSQAIGNDDDILPKDSLKLLENMWVQINVYVHAEKDSLR